MLWLVALESCLSWVGNLELLQTTGTQRGGFQVYVFNKRMSMHFN